jgi:hypothetical protein
MSDIDEMLKIDLSKRLAPSKRDEIDTPGKPHGVVAVAVTAAAAKSEPEKISCRHLRTRKILLIGTGPTGSLNWSDVESANQCLECACILRDNGPQ